MSDSLTPTLSQLLTSTDSFVCFLKGSWGAGKTHYLKDLISLLSDKLKRDKIAYVSLAGLESVDALPMRIFAATDEIEHLRSISAKRWYNRLPWRKATNQALPLFELAAPIGGERLTSIKGLATFAAKAFADSSVRDQIVLLDDLERVSDKIEHRDILSYVTKLRDDRGCQIIMVANEDRIDPEKFLPHKEKTIDAELLFTTNAERASKIAFGIDDGPHTLQERSKKLGITNIRTLVKIKRNYARLKQILTDNGIMLSDELDQQVRATLVVASWFHLDQVFNINDLKNFSFGSFSIAASNGDEKVDSKLVELLNSYNYSNSDAIDHLVISFVLDGVANIPQWKTKVEKFDADAHVRDLKQRYSRAWDTYHDSLDPDPEVFVTSLRTATLNAIEHMDGGSIDSAIHIMRELGREDIADEILNAYIARSTPLPHLRDFYFGVTDQKLRDAVEAKENDEIDDRSLATMIEQLIQGQLSTDDDLPLLAHFTADDFIEFFKKPGHRRVLSVVEEILKIVGWRQPPDKNALKIFANVAQAIRVLNSMNGLNKPRLGKIIKKIEAIEQTLASQDNADQPEDHSTQ